jgi:SpoVK/Ycf46/Vps4 family AAA+-type ATPase
MDAIARKRGSMTSDTTGVRDSVVNQLLAKMDVRIDDIDKVHDDTTHSENTDL